MTPSTLAGSRPLLPKLQEQIANGTLPMPLGNTLGFRVTELTEGHAVIEMETGEKHANTHGYTHGGAILAVADTAMGMAALSVTQEGETSAMVELKTNFLRPAFRTTLRATGKVVRAGRTLTYLECEIVDAEGKLIARASGTTMTLRGEQAVGR